MASDQGAGDLDFESRFKVVLQAAREQSSRACLTVQELLTKDVGPNSMPLRGPL